MQYWNLPFIKFYAILLCQMSTMKRVTMSEARENQPKFEVVKIGGKTIEAGTLIQLLPVSKSEALAALDGQARKEFIENNAIDGVVDSEISTENLEALQAMEVGSLIVPEIGYDSDKKKAVITRVIEMQRGPEQVTRVVRKPDGFGENDVATWSMDGRTRNEVEFGDQEPTANADGPPNGNGMPMPLVVPVESWTSEDEALGAGLHDMTSSASAPVSGRPGGDGKPTGKTR